MSSDWPPDSASFPEGQPPVPPEWDDPEEELPDGADEPDAATLAQLSEVTAYLAAVPAPALPDAVATRISAALAAEAVARSSRSPRSGDEAQTEPPAPDAAGAGARTLGSAPARARVRRHRSYDGRRGLGPRALAATWSVVACLVLAGAVFGLTRIGSSSSSGSYAAGSSAGQSQPVAAPEGSSSASAASSAAAAAPFAPGPVRFAVTASGTRYQAVTLAAQVRAKLANASKSGPTASLGSTPTSALEGCVSHLTHGLSPRLVDRATYQGDSAYIIASSSRVWVVRLGCTAANPELVTSVPLAG